MNIFLRILLAVYAVCLTFISAISMIIAIKPVTFDLICEYVSDNIMTSNAALIVLFIISLIFFILSMTFLLSGIKGSKDKNAVSKHTNIGEIRISLNSIENIALNASKRMNGVRDTRASVEKRNENVSVTIRLVVMPDINIPAISEEIQARVKKSIEESAGIAVENVRVVVDNIYSGSIYKPRVE